MADAMENAAGGIGDKIIGSAMAVAAATSILAMAHHPTGGMGGSGAPDPIHMALIVLLAIMLIGFVRLSQLLDWTRWKSLTGLVAYVIGAAATIGAAIVNGMIVPGLGGYGDGEIGRDVGLMLWEANQALANMGVVGFGIGFLFWGVDLLHRDGWPDRIVGAIGIVLGLVPAVIVGGGYAEMGVITAFFVYAAHALWAMVAGVQIARGSIAK